MQMYIFLVNEITAKLVKDWIEWI